jgi:phosphatidylglycerophosphate synthase
LSLPARRRELEDPLNLHVYHPAARRLALLLRPTGISPNAISFAGFLAIVAAAASYLFLPWPASVLVGFAVHLSWHIFDGADGDLARLSGRTSPMGELVDGACDYIGHIILYVALAAFLDDWIGGWAWLGAALSGCSRILQANHIETRRRTYLWRGYGIPWLRHAEARGDPLFRPKGPVATIFIALTRLYIGVSAVLSPDSAAVDGAIAASAGDPPLQLRLRRLSRAASRRSLAYQHLLGANPRTILLGFSMAAGSPLPYFAIETILLNLVLIASIRDQIRSNRRLAAAFAAQAPAAAEARI